jgi:hypothetical protein
MVEVTDRVQISCTQLNPFCTSSDKDDTKMAEVMFSTYDKEAFLMTEITFVPITTLFWKFKRTCSVF